MGFNAWQGSPGLGLRPPDTGAAGIPAQAGLAAAPHQAPRPRIDGHDRGLEPHVGSLEAQFGAVNAQLRLLLSHQSAAIAASPDSTELMACVQAMEQLHQTLARELARIHELELQVFDTQVALAQARAELQGTQAGERQARYLALHDALTQLPNRRFFMQRLEHALAHRVPPQASLAILFLDLDDFKPINDLHGHHVGDELLRIVGTRLNHHLRSEDMVSRLGGDEFACLRLGAVSRKQLGDLADKLFDLVAAPMQIGALQLLVRPSIGIALCPGDGDCVVDLLRHADAAMYRAKRRRSRHAFFDEATD